MSKKVILTVDDEEHILELIGFNLEINGYEAIKAETGEEALDILKREHVDLVILGATGLNAIERMFIGSVSEYVIRNAVCDVLIVHTDMKNVPFEEA